MKKAMENRGEGRSNRGVSLLEMILVVTLIAGLMASISPAIRVVNMGWQSGEQRLEVVQNARIAMDDTVRALRQARRVSAVSDPGASNGFIEFYDKDDVLQRVDVDGASGLARFGPVGGQSLLAGPVNALEFTCFDSSNTALAAPVAAHEIRSVAIAVTASDAGNRVPDYTLRSKVYMRRDAAVAINEIMYNPLTLSQNTRHEWVELYNLSDRAFDLNGWTLTSHTNRNNPDVLSGELRFGSGETLLPVGGHAVITSANTLVYFELLINRGFESNPLMVAWPRSGGWSRSNGGAQEGNRKLRRNGSGWVYQTTYLPYFSKSGFFSFWERSPSANPENMRLIVAIRSLGWSVLETVYDGPMHSGWTRHYVDLTPYKGQFVRVWVETVGAGNYWIDDFSLSWSFVDQNAVRMAVDDNRIGGGLRNNRDTITIYQGNLAIDSVPYDDNWGGDGNARSLERKSPTGGSGDSANWTQGPIFGTPGRKNDATP